MDQSQTIWTEKYRPKTFEEFKGQERIIERVKAMVKQKNISNFLFAGPAGVGKSTLALIIARDLFGGAYRQNFLELNASNDRGIDVVRNEIKDFARTKAVGDVPFKIIFLDESDALTKEAQQALRRTMENFTNTTRFILSCVTPDTKILLPEEVEINMTDFIRRYQDKKQIEIQNVGTNKQDIKSDLVLATIQLPPGLIGKKVLELTTMTGRRIKVTDDHMLLTTNGWKPAGKLTKSDKLLVHPYMEGTELEYNNGKIIDLQKFVEFVSDTEGENGLKDIGSAQRYKELKTEEKNKINRRILELSNEMSNNTGLTERELEIYKIIERRGKISREQIQKVVGLSRVRMVQLLKSLDKKGHINRIVHKKCHSFSVSNKNPKKLRNLMDIKKYVTNEFNLDISHTTIKNVITKNKKKGRVDRVVSELKRKGLLNLNYNNIKKMGAISRLCGFLLGDGHLTRNNIRLHFSGNKNALSNVKKDLDILGYKNHSKIIVSNKSSNLVYGRLAEGRSTYFTLDSTALSLLFQYLGVTKGDKTVTDYEVPKFIRNGTKFVKREFLRALFGCDADKPNWKAKNCGSISLRQNKSEELKNSILNFHTQLIGMLKEFEVEAYTVIRDKGEVRSKDNKKVLTFELHIKANNKNLFNFLSRIGYAYELYKQKLTMLSSEYLRHKLHIIELWKKKSVAILQRWDGQETKVDVARDYGVTVDFITNQIKGKKINIPWKQFLDFDEWVKKYYHNDILLVNEISEISEINSSTVMDLTCLQDHNFITNGFISHNCNYSSKIIDPIQSRCTIFRFKPLEKEQISEIIDGIAKNEKMKIDKKAVEALYTVSHGDVRRMENILQSCAAMTKNVNEEVIYQLVSAARPKEVKEVLEIALKGEFIKAREKLLDVMLNYGLSGLDIIKQIQREIWNLNIEDEKKVKLVDKCGEIEFRMVEGSDEYVQLEALIANFTTK